MKDEYNSTPTSINFLVCKLSAHWVCSSRADNPSLYAFSSFLVLYDINHSVLQEAFHVTRKRLNIGSSSHQRMETWQQNSVWKNWVCFNFCFFYILGLVLIYSWNTEYAYMSSLLKSNEMSFHDSFFLIPKMQVMLGVRYQHKGISIYIMHVFISLIYSGFCFMTHCLILSAGHRPV